MSKTAVLLKGCKLSTLHKFTSLNVNGAFRLAANTGRKPGGILMHYCWIHLHNSRGEMEAVTS